MPAGRSGAARMNAPMPEVSGEALIMLEAFARENARISELLPWVCSLIPVQIREMRRTLVTLFDEPVQFGEGPDVNEIRDVLREFAGEVKWTGPLVNSSAFEHPKYRVEIRPQDLRVVATAAPSVQRAVQEIISGFLAISPEDSSQAGAYRIKKLPDRRVRQIDLPDDYRLRYLVDEADRVVHVVYLGPHPTGAADGRERVVRSAINRKRNERT